MDENGFGTDPIVIVGMAIEAPGGIDTAEEFWELLSHGREALSPFPVDRGWAVRELFEGSRRNGFKEIHDRGGFLTGATTFDPEFFGISPREAVAMDPQQRVALRVCWRALENSGINPDEMAGHDMGCYLGASATGYGPQMAEFSEYSGHLLAGTALSVISGRVAYTLGSTGPAVTIDSSCASALVAFHAAVRAVQDGDCDVALAGGVNVLGSPGFFVEFSKQHALSDDGHCRAYSAQASGTVWAEGAAVFVLQRKSAALRDGRQILAEVLGSAVNHDGRSAGLSAPSGTAQVNLFRRAMSQAGIRRRGRRHDRGARHRDQARRPHRTAVVGADLRRHRTRRRRVVGVGEVQPRTRIGRQRRVGARESSGRRRTRRDTGDSARRRPQPRDRLGKAGFAPCRDPDPVARR